MKNYLKAFLLFFISGLLVYSNSFNNKFLMDDYVFLRNPVLNQSKFAFLQWNPFREQALGVIDSGERTAYYRPMAHMVLGFCYTAFRNNYWQYHLFNLFLLVLASSLIYLFFEKITENYHWAFLAGLFYLIHPLNGIMVNYISACVFALQVICTLCTLWLLMESLEKKNNRTFYFFSLVFSFLSLFWNESGMMAPFYVCAFVLVCRKDALKSKAFYLFPYFLIFFLCLMFRIFFFRGDGHVLKQMGLSHWTAGEYLASCFQIFVWYIGKLFYPTGIVMQWSMPMVCEHIILNVVGLCVLIALFITLYLKFFKEKACRLAIVWFLTGFAPVFLASLIRPYVGINIEPHWFVFSSIGFFVLAAYLCSLLLSQNKKMGMALLFVLILGLGSVSHAYNQLWVNQRTYAMYWSQEAPYLKSPYFYVASAYHDEGNLKESMKYLTMALSGSDSDASIYISMGDIDLDEGHYKQAELNYKRAIGINPGSALGYNDLGAVYFQDHQWQKASEFFHRALTYNPLMLEPRRGLAVMAWEHSDYAKAVDLCLTNLNIVEGDTETLFLLMDIYAGQKDIVHLQKYAYLMIHDNTDPVVLTKLGNKMAQMNMKSIALDSYKKAIELVPDYKDAYLGAGKIFAESGQYDEAVHIWKLGGIKN